MVLMKVSLKMILFYPIIWALVSTLIGGNCLRMTPRLGNMRMPICTVPSIHEGIKQEETGNHFLLFCGNDGNKLKDIKEIEIGSHHFKLQEGSKYLNDIQTSSKLTEKTLRRMGNEIVAVSDGYKIGLNELKDETIFDKRRNQVNILELAKRALLYDGIIVSLEYKSLLTRGTELNQLKLLDVILFSLKQICKPKLNIHFVIYNMPKLDGRDVVEKEFRERHEKEIEEVLFRMVKRDSDLTHVSCAFTGSSEPTEYLKTVGPFIGARIGLREACKAEFENEAKIRMETVENLGLLQESIGTSVNDVAGNLKGADLVRDAPTFNQLLEYSKAVELRFNNWMQQHGMMLGELPAKLKTEVDTIINSLLTEFETLAKSAGKKNQHQLNIVQGRLVESLQNKLTYLMDSMVLKIQDAVLQEYQKYLQNLPVDDSLDLNLQDAIAIYDNKYCSLVDECTFKILKSSMLHKLKAEMQRKDLILNMKEVANHVLEFAIGKGLFHSKLSLLDGISYIPSNFFTRLLKRLISKVKIPLHISLNYLSPSAFGFSNLFRDRIPLKPGILQYFTGEKEHKTFSSKEDTRKLANSLVHKDH